MNSLLDLRVVVLYPNRGAIETDLAQGGKMVSGEAPRINLHARFYIRGELVVAMDQFAQPAQSVRV